MQVFLKQYSEEVFHNYIQVLQDLNVDPHSEHHNSTIVDYQYDSPYRFGRKMREAVQDEHAPIYSVNGVYWCVASSGLVSFCRSSTIGAAHVPADAIEVA